MQEKRLVRREFSLQWHLTDNCGMRCNHCYLANDTKNTLQRQELTTEQCYKVIDDFVSMIDSLRCDGAIYLTGGDPLMRDDFFDILDYASSKINKVGILGNPTFINDKTIKKLKKARVNRYQLSLDGLEKTHDSVRGNGAFRLAVESLEKLTSSGINVAIMSTVTTKNICELSDVMKFVAEKRASVYTFARVVPIGEGKGYSGELPQPKQYRQFLKEMDEKYKLIQQSNPYFFLTTKDPLWSLYLYEEGRFKPSFADKIIHGCSVGISSLSLDVDGTVLTCRRLETPAGNVIENSLEEIFLSSPQLVEQREVEQIEGCRECNLLPYCRGCRAVAKAINGSFFSKDPQCWKS